MVETLRDIARRISRPLSNSTRLINYYWQRTQRNKLAVFGLAFIIFLVTLAAIGPFFTADPTAVNFEEKEIPPVGFTIEHSVYNIETNEFTTKEISGTWKHPLGTDSKGRDMLAMIVSGARVCYPNVDSSSYNRTPRVVESTVLGWEGVDSAPSLVVCAILYRECAVRKFLRQPHGYRHVPPESDSGVRK